MPIACTGTATDAGGSYDNGYQYNWSVTDSNNQVVSPLQQTILCATGATTTTDSSAPFTFTPTAAGTYTVQLKVTNANGNYGTTTQNIVVGASPFQVVSVAPTTSTGATSLTAATGVTVTFNRAANTSLVNLTDFTVSPVTSGSLVWNSTDTAVTWVPTVTSTAAAGGTTGFLPAGNYTVTLVGYNNNAANSDGLDTYNGWKDTLTWPTGAHIAVRTVGGRRQRHGRGRRQLYRSSRKARSLWAMSAPSAGP